MSPLVAFFYGGLGAIAIGFAYFAALDWRERMRARRRVLREVRSIFRESRGMPR